MQNYGAHKRCLLLASVLLFPVPYFFPRHLWWLTFFLLVPLYRAALCDETFSFCDGYVWGIGALGMHLMPLLYGMFWFAYGSYLFRGLILGSIVFVIAVFTGVWFAVTELLVKYMRIVLMHCSLLWQRRVVVITWGLTTFLFFMWMERACLLCCGRCEGYSVLSPVIPLMERSYGVHILSACGSTSMIVFLISIWIVVTCAWDEKSWHGSVVAATLIIAGFGLGLSTENQQPPSWVARVGVIQRKFFPERDPLITIKAIQNSLDELRSRFPDVVFNIFPESSLYESCIITIPAFCTKLCSSLADKQSRCVIGSFRWFGVAHRNCAYLLNAQGDVLDVCDKSHAVILVEHIPQWVCNSRVTQLYCTLIPQIEPVYKKRNSWVLADDIMIVPYICSELFFNNHPIDECSEKPILALCNDAWAPHCLQRLMVLTAKLRACSWRRDILYCAYGYALWISKDGRTTPVASLQ